MQEKIELNRVRTFGEIIEDSIEFFKQNWKPLLRAYFTICGFFLVASLVISIVNTNATFRRAAIGETPFTFIYFLSIAFGVINYLLVTLTILSYIAVYKEKGNEAPMVEEVWSYVKYFFFRLLGSYLALGALIAAGTVCCLIPGIYFAIVLSLVLPIMVMENATLSYAFSRSFQLIKDHWWFTLGVIFVTEIILTAAMMGIIVPAALITWATTFLTLTNALHIYTYASIVVSHLFQFLYLLPLIGVTLTYFSLTEAKDDGTLLQRIMTIGEHKTTPDEPLTEEY